MPRVPNSGVTLVETENGSAFQQAETSTERFLPKSLIDARLIRRSGRQLRRVSCYAGEDRFADYSFSCH